MRKAFILFLFFGLVLCSCISSPDKKTTLSSSQKPEKKFHSTSLIEASADGSLQEVIDAIEKGADVDSATKDSRGVTALMKAAEAGHFDVVRHLVEKGAEVNCLSKKGYTALMFAAREGDVEVISYLIDNGAEKDIEGSGGATASKWSKNSEVLEIIEKGE